MGDFRVRFENKCVQFCLVEKTNKIFVSNVNIVYQTHHHNIKVFLKNLIFNFQKKKKKIVQN